VGTNGPSKEDKQSDTVGPSGGNGASNTAGGVEASASDQGSETAAPDGQATTKEDDSVAGTTFSSGKTYIT
jgi:hypothetical protein